MWFRATLAGLLTVMLLSLSPLASACEMKCELASMGASWHGASAEMANMQLPGMQHQGVAEKPSTDSGTVLLPTSSACSQHICADHPVLRKGESVGTAPSAGSRLAFVVVYALSLPAVPQGFVLSRAAPLIFTPSPVSLHTTLRV